LPDLNAREYATLIPLIILCFWIGIYPKPLFRVLERPVQLIVEQATPGYYAAHGEAPPVAASPAPSAAPGEAMPDMMNMPGMDMPSDETPASGTEKK